MTEFPYRGVMFDPPWLERGGGKSVRGAQRHYPLMPTKDMPDVIIRAFAEVGGPAPDAHGWMWATDTYLINGEAQWLIKELGFRAVRSFEWVKTLDGVEREEDDYTDADLSMGIGQYGRGCHEHLIFCVRGKGQSPDVWTGNRGVRSVIHAPKGRHSEKPEKSYKLIESVTKGPFLEIFARSLRPGWTSWGNEVP